MLKYFSKFCLSGLLAVLSVAFVDTFALGQETQLEQLSTQVVNVTIEADQVNNYGRLMEQVVSAANDAISNAFTTNANSDPVNVTVLINRNGQVLPVLVAEISHDQWQQQPDVQIWARYSTSVRRLLGYAQPAQTAARTQVSRSSAIFRNAALIDQLD